MFLEPLSCVDERTKLERLINDMFKSADKFSDILYMDSVRIVGMQSMNQDFIARVTQCAL